MHAIQFWKVAIIFPLCVYMCKFELENHILLYCNIRKGRKGNFQRRELESMVKCKQGKEAPLFT